ncbi:hypothetical protein [Cedecea colo]|uniref:Uncharacterized protein n=1 Tax=Cedecea colo TaxID=2552946 RepID=A0ABX0VIB6_9ENTR|nr:hypothetical protein [Cedecea colo]NIY46812.1 hypothetical protein [Cedecea colo]
MGGFEGDINRFYGGYRTGKGDGHDAGSENGMLISGMMNPLRDSISPSRWSYAKHLLDNAEDQTTSRAQFGIWYEYLGGKLATALDSRFYLQNDITDASNPVFVMQ